MKKIALRIAALLVAALMILPLASCGPKSVIGTWISEEIDYSKLINAAEENNDDSDSIPGLKEEYEKAFKDIKIKLVFTFNEDGTYTLEFDEESNKKITDATIDFSKAYTKLIAQSLGMSYEDYLSAMDQTEESFEKNIRENQDEESDKSKGKYKIEENKLFTTDSSEDDFNDNDYDIFEFSGGKLKLVEHHGEDKIPEGVYPIILKKK